MFWIYLPPSNSHHQDDITTEVNLLIVTLLLAKGWIQAILAWQNLWFIPFLNCLGGWLGCVVTKQEMEIGTCDSLSCLERWLQNIGAKVQHMTLQLGRGPADMTPEVCQAWSSSWTRAYPNLLATQCRSLFDWAIAWSLHWKMDLSRTFSPRLSELGPETGHPATNLISPYECRSPYILSP